MTKFFFNGNPITRALVVDIDHAHTEDYNLRHKGEYLTHANLMEWEEDSDLLRGLYALADLNEG